MVRSLEFVKMPGGRVRDKSNPLLKQLTWSGSNKSANIAALMVYIALLHHASSEPTKTWPFPGVAELSYSELSAITSLSRAMVCGGIKVLEQLNLIRKLETKRVGAYQICDYDPMVGWAKLPKASLYNSSNYIRSFYSFHLRKRAELDALKIYLLVIAFRDRATNHTLMSYDNIEAYTGISRNYIRTAVSFLVVHGLIHVDQKTNSDGVIRTRNLYRVVGLRGRHLGNISEDVLASEEKNEEIITTKSKAIPF